MAEDEQHPANKNRTGGIEDFIGAVFSKIISSSYREFCLSSSTNLSQINDKCKIPNTRNVTRDNENLRRNYSKDENPVVSSIINDYWDDAPQTLNMSQPLWMSSHLDENIESMPAVASQVYLKVNKENNDESHFSDLGLEMVTVNQPADSQIPVDGIFVAEPNETNVSIQLTTEFSNIPIEFFKWSV